MVTEDGQVEGRKTRTALDRAVPKETTTIPVKQQRIANRSRIRSPLRDESRARSTAKFRFQSLGITNLRFIVRESPGVFYPVQLYKSS